MPAQARAFCWTWNNPTDEPDYDAKTMNYMVFVLQEAPKTGTPHYQGYTQYREPQYLHELKRKLKRHVEIARGTWQDNKTYICDDAKRSNRSDPYEYGTPEDIEPPKRQGQRTDLEAVKKDVDEGASELTLYKKHANTMARYPKFAERYRQLVEMGEPKEITWPVMLPWCMIEKPDPANKKRNWWIWGPPDVGKTYEVQKALEGTKTFMAGPEPKHRFEGWNGEALIVYDDVMPELEELLSATNVWLLSTERPGGKRYSKGYWTKGQARTVVVLHNTEPPFKSVPQFASRFNVVCTHHPTLRRSDAIASALAAAQEETKQEAKL